MSRLHEYKIGKIDYKITTGYISNRIGTRHNKGLKRTARACGRNWEPAFSWRTRSQGIASVKAQKAREMKNLGKSAKQAAKGDLKA